MLMAASLLLQFSVATMGLIAHPYTTLSVYRSSRPRSGPETEQAHWAVQPTAKQIAAMPAAHITGGARAMVYCKVAARGTLNGCTIEAVEPHRQQVRLSALGATALYRLTAEDRLKVRESKKPPYVALVLVFPDKRGRLPTDFNPAFACAPYIIGPPRGKPRS
ncbi:hypothetical protein [Sphingomonas sp. 10B4]|uniref:hypothetical protein n=1 Tax=Sphingomonas sp. 10B4 TaxID=3048575 RepID=UPI002AB54352|nr:hypothetical protein [Sphingomonas sp. 10B4]MDY7522651.1 hypothetical protein [Sphingomonas sp. 10B4]MEB0281792.1 hypothetical protein [Sphingomonas sp. 10B4]